MYTQFFGLREKPFSITPDPHFLFLSERHAEALAHLVYGITESGGFIQLTGEVGTGKTTLTRSLLERLPDTVDLAVVLNPRLSVDEFLGAIFEELRIRPPAPTATSKDRIDALNRHLLDAHARGRRTVLLVDEAQNLDTDVLEQLRLLTNLETAKSKLLQIILVGQPELRQLLARNDLRQLAQRITGRYHLRALTAKESIAYVRHRLKIAGAEQEIFSAAALWEVHRLAAGVPRLINVICDRALLGGFTAERQHINRKIVRAAAAEISGDTHLATSPWLTLTRLAAGAAFVVLAIAVFVGLRTYVTPAAPVAEANVGPAAAISAPTVATITKTPASLSSLPMRSTSLQVSERLAPLPRTQIDQPQAKPFGPSLASLLADPAVDTGTDEALRQLFFLWSAPLNDARTPCAQAPARGLRCAFQVGSWRLLRTMNRPAILSLVDDSGTLHNALLTALDKDSATLRMGDLEFRFAIDEVSRFWFGEYLILWRPPAGGDELLLPGTQGEGVAWLRATLHDILGVKEQSARPDYFDSALKQRLQSFQRSRRLEADGKAGVQTLIAINSATDSKDTPYLEKL